MSRNASRKGDPIKKQLRYIPDECTVDGCPAPPYCAWYKSAIGGFVGTCRRHRPLAAQTLPRYRVVDEVTS